MLRIAAATAAFGIVHSALASRPAKRAAADLFGPRNRHGLYRVCFIGQSLISFAALAAFIRKQPNRELYRVRNPVAYVMHAGQAAAVVYAISAAHQVGVRRILGAESFLAWSGDAPVPREPEAQGPALDAEGMARGAGPFAWSRHPLNFVPVPIFWLWPRMTTNLLAFNLAATAYVVAGSLHEEARLRAEYGERYAAYQASGVPYYVPAPRRGALQPVSRLLPAREAASGKRAAPAMRRGD